MLGHVASTDGLGLEAKRGGDPHAEHWQTLARVGEAIACSPTCGPEQATEFCRAVDRLSAALMGGENEIDAAMERETLLFALQRIAGRCDAEPAYKIAQTALRAVKA